MTKDKQHKNEALRLHKSGVVPSKIASKLGTSVRTIQRWLRDEKPVPVSVVSTEAAKDATEPIAKNVAVCRDKFDLTLSRRTAIRLMNLSCTALDAVEAVLNNPDARPADKLRAAKIVGDWLNVGAPARYIVELSTCSPSFLERRNSEVPPSSPPPDRGLQAVDEDEEN